MSLIAYTFTAPCPHCGEVLSYVDGRRAGEHTCDPLKVQLYSLYTLGYEHGWDAGWSAATDVESERRFLGIRLPHAWKFFSN